jgi:hypothetical protein
MRIEHKHVGRADKPCGKCGRPARLHRTRAAHAFEGQEGLCSRCGLPRAQHRGSRAAYDTIRRRRAGARPRAPRSLTVVGCLALDGEGYTDRRTGAHHYCYLAASDASGTFTSELWRDGKPLRTGDVLEWLFTLPNAGRVVMYGSQYDWTKWFEHLPDKTLHVLWRPEKRKGEHGGTRAVYVDCNTYASTDGGLTRGKAIGSERYGLNMIGSKLTVSRRQGAARVTVWDILHFFDTSFVATLGEWKIGTRAERRAIQRMKDRRGKFKRIGSRERAYCRSEVRLMARLGDALLAACVRAGLPLTALHGSGSIADAMLKRDGAKARRPIVPKEMQDAVERAFFGGHFELSRCGPVRPAHSHDLASAYAAAEAVLPCLAHGQWRHVHGEQAVLKALSGGAVGLVRYALPSYEGLDAAELPDEALFATVASLTGEEPIEVPPLKHKAVSSRPWGPFPFRLPDQSIVFPVASAGGWVWHYEFLAARRHPRLWPNVLAREAWIFEPRCRCAPPFFDGIVRDYIERLRVGKDDEGRVLKKGLASRYGKRAQSVGTAPYRCHVTAGLITSRVRAALLDAIATAPDPWDVLSVSADSVIARRPLNLAPIDERLVQATAKAAKRAGKAPLGAWVHKARAGVHLIRPGQRFSLGGTARGESDTAARGVDIKILRDNRGKILKSWAARPRMSVTLKPPPLFWGARMSIDDRGVRSPNYGKWIPAPDFVVGYVPLPKRPMIRADGRLWTWAFLSRQQSAVYDRDVAAESRHVRQLVMATAVAEAQPGGAGPGVTGDG